MPELGWVIVYVPDVEEALELYERAFGLRRSFLDPKATFGQLDTGSTALAFASEARGAAEIGRSFRSGGIDREPVNVEICLVFEDPQAAFARAVEAGCIPLTEPARKPHGQTTGFVRDPFGTLVEIASPLEPRA